jgi:hypothetical protein
MKLRLWPRSLIGQLVFAVAVVLFVAQAVNFALLARGQKQQSLAHGGGMAVARIIDAMDRQERAQTDVEARRKDRRRSRHEPKVWIDTVPPPVPGRSVALPDLAGYVGNLLAEANISSKGVQAWALPQPPRIGRTQLPGRTVLVVAEIDGRFYGVRSRMPGGGNRLQGFLIWQTLSLYFLLLVPVMLIAWRAARPLRDPDARGAREPRASRYHTAR